MGRRGRDGEFGRQRQHGVLRRPDEGPAQICGQSRSAGNPATLPVNERPPTRSRPSKTSTWCPCRVSSRAATRPAKPAPTTTTSTTRGQFCTSSLNPHPYVSRWHHGDGKHTLTATPWLSCEHVIVTDPASATDARPQLRTVALGSMIGTTIEWYDFYLYATASALVFKPLFFPNISSTAGTLASFATYAAGFGARPIGAVVSGHFGDRLGRKAVLVAALLVMGLVTTAIGVLPTYAEAGLLARDSWQRCGWCKVLRWAPSGAVRPCCRWSTRRPDAVGCSAASPNLALRPACCWRPRSSL